MLFDITYQTKEQTDGVAGLGVYMQVYIVACYTHVLCTITLVQWSFSASFCFLMTVFLQTVEEIEGVLGRDLYPNLSEERSRWEKELAGLREENESLTAMLCSKEEELNRTKATMNAIREERDRLRRRVRVLHRWWFLVPPSLHNFVTRTSFSLILLPVLAVGLFVVKAELYKLQNWDKTEHNWKSTCDEQPRCTTSWCQKSCVNRKPDTHL